MNVLDDMGESERGYYAFYYMSHELLGHRWDGIIANILNRTAYMVSKRA